MKTGLPKSSAGFSLVEIMIGMTIGLITLLVVSQVMQVAEARKKTSTAGADAIVNANLGLYTIERDGKNAGYGLTTIQSSVGCEIKAKYDSNVRDFNLVPVVLGDSANGAPDTLRFLASNKSGISTPVRIAIDHPKTAANFFVASDLGVEEGDLMVAVPSTITGTNWCSLFQVTGTGGGGGGGGGNGGGGNGGGNAQGQNQVLHNSGQSEWNHPGNATFPTAGYAAGDYVINLGSLLDHTYSIAGGNLRLTAYRLEDDSFNQMDLYPNVVQLQAVYGKDTNEDDMVDAWNTTAPTTMAQWQQVIAIRVALVARGNTIEAGTVTLDGANDASTCNSATPHPAAVCWRPDPTGNGVKIDVSANSPNWQRYQYRVVETTIPLRNAIWRR